MNITFHKEIDSLLGNRDGRYFGDGYLHTDYYINQFKLSNSADDLAFSCVGSVLLPKVWSKKGESFQKPHLSTIDVIELTLETLRYLLENIFHRKHLSAASLKSIAIVAGKSPVEDEIDSIKISGIVRRNGNDSLAIDMNVANMSLQLQYSFLNNDKSIILSSRKQPIEIENVVNLTRDDYTTAFGVVKPLIQQLHHNWSISSCFAASLQLGQALLYQLDGINRADSNTLWMKRTAITLAGETCSASAFPQPIYVRLDDTRKYTKSDDEWRRADIFSLICNMKIICSVTHKLPQKTELVSSVAE